MPQGTLKGNSEAYVHYTFSCVKCQDCGVESNPFVTKDHLEADELIIYIQDISGFTFDNVVVDSSSGVSFTAGNGDSSRGGLLCPICNEKRHEGEIREVSNG